MVEIREEMLNICFGTNFPHKDILKNGEIKRPLKTSLKQVIFQTSAITFLQADPPTYSDFINDFSYPNSQVKVKLNTWQSVDAKDQFLNIGKDMQLEK